MFLFPAADIQEDNGTVALLAEDFNFASFWRLNNHELDDVNAYENDQILMDYDSLSPAI
jgi:hypothetical protein